MDERVLQLHISFAKLAVGVGLTEPRDGMQFHLASGFVVKLPDDSLLIATAGHSMRDFVKWNREGIVAACCVYHHSTKNESELVEYPLDLEHLDHQMHHSLDVGIDCGVLLLDVGLDLSLVQHCVPSFRLPDDLKFPETKERMTGYTLAICGFSGHGSNLIETPPIALVSGDEIIEHSNLKLGTLRSRIERVVRWENEGNGQRVRLFLESQQHPSVKGMSGGPVIIYHKDDKTDLRVVGQQIAEQPLPGGKGFEYLVANNSLAVVNSISHCLAKRDGDS